jgi:hypothetical protein
MSGTLRLARKREIMAIQYIPRKGRHAGETGWRRAASCQGGNGDPGTLAWIRKAGNGDALFRAMTSPAV